MAGVMGLCLQIMGNFERVLGRENTDTPDLVLGRYCYFIEGLSNSESNKSIFPIAQMTVSKF